MRAVETGEGNIQTSVVVSLDARAVSYLTGLKLGFPSRPMAWFKRWVRGMVMEGCLPGTCSAVGSDAADVSSSAMADGGSERGW